MIGFGVLEVMEGEEKGRLAVRITDVTERQIVPT
jgi:hypothetical protein